LQEKGRIMSQPDILLGVVTGFIPGDKEKQVMKAMVDEGDPTNKVT